MTNERKARRTHGVPETRGMLRTYRMCGGCRGAGGRIVEIRAGLERGAMWQDCPTCAGTGRLELLGEEYDTVATRQAKAVVRETQGKGRYGREM